MNFKWLDVLLSRTKLQRVGLSFTWTLGTGYKVDPKEEKQQRGLARLKKACAEAVKDFEPQKNFQGEITETYCNKAVNYVSSEMGFLGFKDLVANGIVQRMRNAPDFALVSAEAAQALANAGRLVIAGMNNIDGPGHVAVVHPGTLIYSGHWRDKAPTIANVGMRNGIMSANYAFRDKPDFWAWIGDKV